METMENNGDATGTLARKMLSVKVIGICGYARCGKDSFAQIIKKYGGEDFEIFSMADPLRDLCRPLIKNGLGINLDGVDAATKTKIRPIMVGVGEGFRAVDKDFWVKKMAQRIGESPKQCFVIPDIRYPNEGKWLKSLENGRLIHIFRDGIEAPNESERRFTPVLASDFSDISVKIPTVGEKNILTNPQIIAIVLETLERIYGQTTSKKSSD